MDYKAAEHIRTDSDFRCILISDGAQAERGRIGHRDGTTVCDGGASRIPPRLPEARQRARVQGLPLGGDGGVRQEASGPHRRRKADYP